MRDERFTRDDETMKIIRLFLRLLARLSPHGQSVRRD